MGALDLLNSLADAGLTVAADGDRLVIRPASKLTDPLRDALRDAKPELLQLLSRICPDGGSAADNPVPSVVARIEAWTAPPQHMSEGLLSGDAAERCHFGGWTDAEISVFVARRDRLLRWGRPDEEAESLAERLTLRDRDADERRCCCECSHLADGGHCLAAARGRSTNAGIEPITLHRCQSFGLRKGLT